MCPIARADGLSLFISVPEERWSNTSHVSFKELMWRAKAHRPKLASSLHAASHQPAADPSSEALSCRKNLSTEKLALHGGGKFIQTEHTQAYGLWSDTTVSAKWVGTCYWETTLCFWKVIVIRVSSQGLEETHIYFPLPFFISFWSVLK